MGEIAISGFFLGALLSGSLTFVATFSWAVYRINAERNANGRSSIKKRTSTCIAEDNHDTRYARALGPVA